MKCSKCGSNLAIENAFCPYCGTENQFAKQHRADMAKFTKDYKATKAEVIGNSKKFNKKTFRITAVSVTIAAILMLFFFSLTIENIIWDHEYNTAARESESHLYEIQSLIEADDYMGLYELVEKYDIHFRYDSKIYEYSSASNVASYYKSLYVEILYILEPQEYARSNYSSRIAEAYTSLMEETTRTYYDEKAESALTFAEHAYRDAGLMLKTYLGLTDEDLDSWGSLSTASRNLMIEEAYNNVIKEK